MHKKQFTLSILFAVFAVISIAAVLVSRHEAKVEQIKNSGETILAIPTDTVTALSWTNEEGTFSFTKAETWECDDDASFPVDEEKINDLLSQFEDFTASFVIDNVEDYAQYGLTQSICTINITAGEETYTVELGDFSKMDGQRYVSIGDDKAYLVGHDPLDEFDAVLRDMILDDTIPEFDTVETITFSGNEDYEIVYDVEETSICANDVYFTDGEPLDTDNVDEWLMTLQSLNLTNYVSYNVTDEELRTFGLDDPDLIVMLGYSSFDEEGNETDSGTLTLCLAKNPDEQAAYNEAVENANELPDVTCYARVDNSHIVYQITQSEFDNLTAVSYDTLRHQKLFTADFDTVTSVDIMLEGGSYTFDCNQPESGNDKSTESTWTYEGKEFDISNFSYALCALTASSFTEESPDGQEEISLTVYLENESFPTFTLTIYRYDGTNCIAAVNGKPVAFVSRSMTVDLIEAVNELTLGG